ncbi:MAG: hypothetical protein D6798_18725, partial [Deltaproteobacteria bacterium]
MVHPLTPLLRRLLGVRTLSPALVLDRGDGPGGVVAQLGIPGVALGTVVSLSLTPEQMLADQHLALQRMVELTGLVPEARAIGLGSLCAVVAGRGEELARRIDRPVTTGGAATAWAVHDNVRRLLAARGLRRGPVAIVGSSGPVGRALAVLLSGDGVDVVVDHARGGRGLPVRVAAGPDEAAAGCPVVIGAGPTGGSVSAEVLAAGTVVVDVAIPGTVRGVVPPDVQVLLGEAVVPPPTWSRRLWGRLYHLFSGYGPRQVFACAIEPLVMVASGRTAPFALGRHLDVDDVRRFGRQAAALGFRPRLA